MSQYQKMTLLSSLPDLSDIVPPEYQKPMRTTYQPPQESGMNYNQPIELPPTNLSSSTKTLHCIDVVEHITNCIICSKFYSNDRGVYIVIIIFLLIVCTVLISNLIKMKNSN